MYFVIKKTKDSVFNASVQQGACMKDWSDEKYIVTPNVTNKSNWGKNLSKKLPEGLKDALWPLYGVFLARKPKFNLKPIAIY